MMNDKETARARYQGKTMPSTWRILAESPPGDKGKDGKKWFFHFFDVFI
jgi:hypothetical protein